MTQIKKKYIFCNAKKNLHLNFFKKLLRTNLKFEKDCLKTVEGDIF